MKNVTLLFCLSVINLFFFSCSRSDQKSNQEDATAVVTANTGVFTKEEAELGDVLYTNNCVACHGRDLRGTEGGNALIGERFVAKWKDKSLGELFELTKATMPKTNPHSLDDASYSALLAFILSANGFPSGDVELLSNKEELQAIVMGSHLAPSRLSLGFIPKKFDPKPVHVFESRH